MTPQERIDYVVNKAKQYDMPYVEGETPISMAFIVDLIEKIEAHKEDTVKREAVLNTLDTMDKALDENRTVEHYKELLKECYKELPPVQSCEDAVSREAVLSALSELPHEYKTKEQRARTGGIAACQVIVRELPPVIPKQRTGKWEEFDHGMGIIFLKCPFCGEFQSKADNHNFCPNCGAKMEGDRN